MRLDTPDLASGDFEVTSFAYFGEVNATVKLGDSLNFRDVTDDDADRLIRAACAAKKANAAERERIAQPHPYFKAGPRCLRCGKPEDDELHAEPEPDDTETAQAEELRRVVLPHCGARWPNRSFAGGQWICTLDKGHDGDHEAGTPADGRPFYSSVPQDDGEVTWDAETAAAAS